MLWPGLNTLLRLNVLLRLSLRPLRRHVMAYGTATCGAEHAMARDVAGKPTDRGPFKTSFGLRGINRSGSHCKRESHGNCPQFHGNALQYWH